MRCVCVSGLGCIVARKHPLRGRGGGLGSIVARKHHYVCARACGPGCMVSRKHPAWCLATFMGCVGGEKLGVGGGGRLGCAVARRLSLCVCLCVWAWLYGLQKASIMVSGNLVRIEEKKAAGPGGGAARGTFQYSCYTSAQWGAAALVQWQCTSPGTVRCNTPFMTLYSATSTGQWSIPSALQCSSLSTV